MANKILVLDAGHGFNTAGKQTMNGSRGIVKEWTMNDSVVRKITSILSAYNVTIHRTDDPSGKTDISLAERVRRCNSYKPDLFVSIHENAGGGTGTEVYWHTYGTAEDKKVAGIVAPKLASKTGLRNRGVKQAQFAVLGCNATAILVEGGFMDTKSDYEIITSDKGQQQYAEAVAESIIEYLGLTKVVTSQPSQPASTPSSFKVGDKVKVKTTATHYATGQTMASFVKGSTYEVTKVDGSKLLLSDISSWVWDYDVEKVGSVSTAKPFAIGEYNAYVVTTDNLNVRSKRNASSSLVGTLPKGTRVEVKYILGVDDGHTEPFWGSVYTSYGNGFINLNYTQPTI